MTPTETKLKAVRDWAKPQNVKDIQSFLGFSNYYRHFVKNFASVAGPLMDLTWKNVLWQWGPYQRLEMFHRQKILVWERLNNCFF